MTTTLSLYTFALWLAAAPMQQGDGNRVIASTSNWSITAQQFELILETLPDQARAFYSSAENRRRFLDQMIEMWTLAAEARAQGLEKLDSTRAMLDFYTNNILSTAYGQQLARDNQVTDAAIEAYYKANEADYREVKLSHILILNAEGPAVRGQPVPGALPAAEARQKIEEVKAKLVPGASFEDLAKEYSQDPGSAANGGDLGFISKGQLVPEVENVAFEMPENVLSDIVESPFGFHILKVTGRRATPLADIRETIRQKVNTDQIDAQIKSKIDAADVKVDETFFSR